MSKAAELRELDDTELADHLAGARKELFNLRFQLATGRLDNISRIGVVRKEIARLITLGVEREAGGSGNAANPGAPRIARPGVTAGASSRARAGASTGGDETEDL